jgi:hypothetical protein
MQLEWQRFPYATRGALRDIQTACLSASASRFAFLKSPPCRVRNRKLGGSIRSISTSMSCIIAGFLIEYQLK